MKKQFMTSLIVGLGVFGGIILSSNQVRADANNGIVTTVTLAHLYNNEGKITNRSLDNNTAWLTNQKIELTNVGAAYKVSSDEFVKAQDVQFSPGQAVNGVINVGGNGATIYNYQNDDYAKSSNTLDPYSRWQYNFIDKANGKTWYQIGTNSWISDKDASTNMIINNSGTIQISYAPDSGIDLYQGYGNDKSATGQKLTNGTSWKFSQKVVDINGDAWYEIGNNQWVSGQYTKVSNGVFDGSAAKVWDPNYAALEVTSDTPIYSDSSYNSNPGKTLYSGTIVEVDSTVQDGNTIWYEISDGGWLPSSSVQTITATRNPVSLNGKTKDQVIADVISSAKAQLGKPYVWNAKGPDSYDCSGLMQYVFRQATGQNIGSWTVPQETAGTKVSINDLQRGDLVFWGPEGASYHVGLYLGDNQYLNALRPGTNVKIDHISSNFEPSFGVRIF